MAPLPVAAGQSFMLHKRDYENTTWRAIIGAIGAFLLVGLIGIFTGWWRHRLAKRRDHLQAIAEKGSYTKLENGRCSLDDAQSSNGLRILRLQRTNSTSSSSSSNSTRQDEQQSRRTRRLQPRSQHRRSQSLSLQAASATRGQNKGSYLATRGRSQSTQPNTETFITLRGVITGQPLLLPPPQAAHVDLDPLGYMNQEETGRLTRIRSPSPAPLVLSRSMSMLRPRSISLGR